MSYVISATDMQHHLARDRQDRDREREQDRAHSEALLSEADEAIRRANATSRSTRRWKAIYIERERGG